MKSIKAIDYAGLEEQRMEAVRCIERASEAISNLASEVARIRDEAQGYYDERSDKWRDESDAGQAYAEWIEKLDELADLSEIETPDALDGEIPQSPES